MEKNNKNIRDMKTSELIDEIHILRKENTSNSLDLSDENRNKQFRIREEIKRRAPFSSIISSLEGYQLDIKDNGLIGDVKELKEEIRELKEIIKQHKHIDNEVVIKI